MLYYRQVLTTTRIIHPSRHLVDTPDVPSRNPEELKSQFCDRLSFWGAIDQQKLLPFGTPAQIEADVRAKIEVLGRRGGYMCTPPHIIQADALMENIEAFINAVKKYGVYVQQIPLPRRNRR